MTTLTMSEVICMALFCSLLGPSLGLSSLHGLNSGRTRRGLFGDLLGGILGGGGKDGGKGGGEGGDVSGGVLEGGDKGDGGGVLGGVLGGGDKSGGGGVLDGVLGGGDKGGGGGVLGGVLGGGDKGGGGGVLDGVLGGGDKGGGGGVLGGVLGGGDKGGGGGVLGGVLGGGDKGTLGGVLGGVGGLLNNATNSVLAGGGLPVAGDVLGGVLDGGGGKGGLLNGVLGNVGGLLNNTNNSLLAGGLLNPNQLRQLLGSLDGNLLGLGSGGMKEPFQWGNILNLQFIRGSWKIVGGTELILNLQATMVMKLPILLFRTVTLDVNITTDLAIIQDKPGDLKLVLKNCRNLAAGFMIKLPPSLIATLLSNVVNLAVQNSLPGTLCPIFQVWINVINAQLRFLNNYVFFGLLSKIHTALSSMPFSTGHFSELDLKDKPFPGFFLNWLLNSVNSKIIPMIA